MKKTSTSLLVKILLPRKLSYLAWVVRLTIMEGKVLTDGGK